MPAPIPPVLSPYLSDPSPGTLLLITSVLSAPANWLAVCSISNALNGYQKQNARIFENSASARRYHGCRVIVLSILRSLSLWTEVGKKAGLDIPNLIANRQLLYIDGLEIYGRALPPSAASVTATLPSHGLQEVKDALHRAIDSSYEGSRTTGLIATSAGEEADPTEGPILVLDGLDFLIASHTDVTATTISQMLTQIRQRVHSTILMVSSDGPLLHGSSVATTPLEMESQAFVTSMAHQSQFVMQLRGLDSGSAKDVSGVIRISHGGEFEDDSQEQDQPGGEWLYKVSGDGSVRVWGRGE